ncbi:hypothetical protein ANANG_G00217120 [Anguilla anguilla]|uniref:C2 domain-containing protein n=1 Tax=Anguilla anguilla TaxID=7936 RepID=A0A9D3RP21_ANGAN|nr:hypothetical protein ANANG_G00217120 [Anguilla anguilla]
MEGDVMDKLEDMASVCEFDPVSGSIPATKVEITVSCRNLLDKDTFSKSDPLCVLYTQGVETKQWREFGRTEVIDNTLNPDFVRKYILDYFFEEKQNLRFDLYDVDSKSPDLSKHPSELSDFLGQVFCTLGEIVGSPGSRLEKPLGGIPGKKCGSIILSAEELGNCRDSATMQFCANKLDKKDFFGKSDPFMVFYRSNEDGTFTICHKTEVVKNTLNPVWQAFSPPCTGRSAMETTPQQGNVMWQAQDSERAHGRCAIQMRRNGERARNKPGKSFPGLFPSAALTNQHAVSARPGPIHLVVTCNSHVLKLGSANSVNASSDLRFRQSVISR